MNKMKIENIFLKGAIGVYAGCAIASVALTFKYNDAAFLIEGVLFFIYAFLTGIILSKNKKIEKHIIDGGALAMLLKRLLDDLERYHKQYGPLPEEKQEKKEEYIKNIKP